MSKEDTVTFIAKIIDEELHRQAEAPGPTPYLVAEDGDLSDYLIDGRIDVIKIAQRIAAALKIPA